MTVQLGADGQECFVSIALLGINPKEIRDIAALHSEDAVEQWLCSHERSQVDPERWRAVYITTRRGSIRTNLQRVSAAEWNRGVRWESEVEAVIDFIGRDRPNERLGTLRGRRALRRLFADYEQYGDSRLWSAVHVSWKTPDMDAPIEESIPMDSWEHGAQWPLLAEWVQRAG